MEILFKATAGILLTVILCQALSKQGKDMALLLSVAVCCMVLALSGSFFRSVLGFVDELQTLGQLNTDILKILMKAVGIGILTEITVLVCSDVGNSALGKSLQILSSAVILWLSLPLFEKLLALLQSVLEAS